MNAIEERHCGGGGRATFHLRQASEIPLGSCTVGGFCLLPHSVTLVNSHAILYLEGDSVNMSSRPPSCSAHGEENLAISTLGLGMVLVPEAIVVGYYVQ
jgi:hypothetical protein